MTPGTHAEDYTQVKPVRQMTTTVAEKSAMPSRIPARRSRSGPSRNLTNYN